MNPAIQEYIASVSVKEEQDEIKKTHSAVAKLGNARKNLGNTLIARQQLHSSWMKFLASTIEQWQNYTMEFKKQDHALLENITTAQEQLATAKQAFAASRADLGLTEAAPVEVSDDDKEKEEKSSKAMDISTDMDRILDNFKALHSQAEALVREDEQAAKRFKAGHQSEQASSPAMVPFGAASR